MVRQRLAVLAPVIRRVRNGVDEELRAAERGFMAAPDDPAARERYFEACQAFGGPCDPAARDHLLAAWLASGGRDPRKDPSVGDVILIREPGGEFLFTVEGVRPGFVEYSTAVPGRRDLWNQNREMGAETWRAFFATARMSAISSMREFPGLRPLRRNAGEDEELRALRRESQAGDQDDLRRFVAKLLELEILDREVRVMEEAARRDFAAHAGLVIELPRGYGRLLVDEDGTGRLVLVPVTSPVKVKVIGVHDWEFEAWDNGEVIDVGGEDYPMGIAPLWTVSVPGRLARLHPGRENGPAVEFLIPGLARRVDGLVLAPEWKHARPGRRANPGSDEARRDLERRASAGDAEASEELADALRADGDPAQLAFDQGWHRSPTGSHADATLYLDSVVTRPEFTELLERHLAAGTAEAFLGGLVSGARAQDARSKEGLPAGRTSPSARPAVADERTLGYILNLASYGPSTERTRDGVDWRNRLRPALVRLLKASLPSTHGSLSGAIGSVVQDVEAHTLGAGGEWTTTTREERGGGLDEQEVLRTASRLAAEDATAGFFRPQTHGVVYGNRGHGGQGAVLARIHVMGSDALVAIERRPRFGLAWETVARAWLGPRELGS